MKLCCCFRREDSNGTISTEVKREVCRLKWNWLYVLLLSSLGTINTSSPLGTLHQFVTNPPKEQALSAKYEPGLGESEPLYAWTVSINNIGGFIGAILGASFSNLVPYWYGFLFSLLCHIAGFLLYGLARYGWMIVLSRFLTGVFTGLQRALAFAYFGVSYQHYISTLENAGMKESTTFCRVKDVLFSLYTVSTSAGLLIGTGFSAVIATIHNVDHFRAVGWYNLAFGLLLLLLLVLTFHGEYCWKPENESSLNYLKQIKEIGWNCWQKWNMSKAILVLLLILCTAIVKAKASVYEELFNPVLSDSFGFSEDVSVYFFLVIMVVPILGGLLLLLLEWTRLTNLVISILGILATILGLLVMTDWQAIPHDPCLTYSIFHHPELLMNYSTPSQVPNQPVSDEYCWLYNETNSDHPEDLFGKGSLQIVLNPLVESIASETIDCELFESHQSCLNCQEASIPQVSLRFEIESQYICYEPDQDKMNLVSEGSTVNVLCRFQNSSCVSVCLELNDNDNETESLRPQLLKQISKSFIEAAYEQSITILEDNQYHMARNVCESHEEDNCHWIPYSFLINKRCVDCQPICRGVGRTLNFIQFAIGSIWFMFTSPIARVSLPIVISDSVGQEYQGLVMGITVASTELLQGVTPLWLSAAYEAAQKRTFLPLLILTATFLPVLFGLIALYFVKRQGCTQKRKRLNSQEGSRLLESNDPDPSTEK